MFWSVPQCFLPSVLKLCEKTWGSEINIHAVAKDMIHPVRWTVRISKVNRYPACSDPTLTKDHFQFKGMKPWHDKYGFSICRSISASTFCLSHRLHVGIIYITLQPLSYELLLKVACQLCCCVSVRLSVSWTTPWKMHSSSLNNIDKQC